jgi:hypothetical protein
MTILKPAIARYLKRGACIAGEQTWFFTPREPVKGEWYADEVGGGGHPHGWRVMVRGSEAVAYDSTVAERFTEKTALLIASAPGMREYITSGNGEAEGSSCPSCGAASPFWR